MKKHYLLLFLMVCCEHLLAQETCAFLFTAEGNDYIEVQNAVPGSSIAFYSQKEGGKRLRSITVDQQGKVSFINTKKQSVSFVVNIKNTTTQVEGNKKVIHFTGKEFVFENLTLQNNDHGHLLQWDATFSNSEHYYFEILTSADGEHYNAAGFLYPSSKDILTYQYQLKNTNSRFYKVNVHGVKNEINYLSKSLEATDEHVEVYPTIIRSVLHINGITECYYALYNIQGQIIKEGILTNKTNTITVNDLSAGAYFLNLKTSEKNVTYKLYKE